MIAYSESRVLKNNSKWMVLDGLNKAAPGLFPRMVTKDLRVKDGEYQEPDSSSERGSVRSEDFKKIVESLPREYEELMMQDKFYLVRKYMNLERIQQNDVIFEDFQQYNKLLMQENELREKLSVLTNVMSNKGMVLPLIEVGSLRSASDRSVSLPMKAGRTRSALKFNRAVERLRKKFMQSHVTSDESAQGSSSQLYNSDFSQSIDGTEIIDDIMPEGFIDFERKYAENAYNMSHFNKKASSDGKKSILSRSRLLKRDHANTYTIQRKLHVRHLQMISLGATIGVGLLLNSGKALSIGGPLGALIGFTFAACVVVATVLSFAEIVALIPLITGISGLCSRFVSDAFGFSVGWCHWISYALAFPAELTASLMMLASIEDLNALSYNSKYQMITLICFIVLLASINLLDVRYYGEFEYLLSAFKLLVVIFLIVLMIVVNVGTFNGDYLGFRYWASSKSPRSDITYGPFRPTFDLNDVGTGSLNGIGGFGGVLLSCIAAILISIFSYVGIEVGFIAAGEAQNPRKAVPLVTKRIFTRIIIFYLLSIFVMGINVYGGDPRLLRYSERATSTVENYVAQISDIISHLGGLNCEISGSSGGPGSYFEGSSNQAPWIIALKSCNQCTLSTIVQSFFVAVGLSAASSQLYASSRTLYAMATQGKAPSIFTICSKRGVPFVSVLMCSAFGFLAFLSVNGSSAEVFILLVNLGTTGGVIMWFGMNLSFYRLYYALKRRTDITSRNAKEYPYKSPFQPYLCIFGMLSTFLVLVLNGLQNFLHWNARNFVSSYLTSILFIVLYLGYAWIGGSKISKLDQIDLDSGRREMDLIKWQEKLDYTLNIKEFALKILSYL